MECSKSGEGFASYEMAGDPTVVGDLQYFTNGGPWDADIIFEMQNEVSDGGERRSPPIRCPLNRVLGQIALNCSVDGA